MTLRQFSSASHQTCMLVTISVPLLCVSATGQNLQGEGQFSITYTAVNASPIKPLPLGNERELIVNPAIMTALNDAGSGLLHNMAGRCFVFTTIDRAAKTVGVRGNCVYAEGGGDQVYEEFSMPAPVPLGTPVKFRGRWTGGTGKYSGLSGEFEIITSGPIATDGPTQGAGKKVGSYKIAR